MPFESKSHPKTPSAVPNTPPTSMITNNTCAAAVALSSSLFRSIGGTYQVDRAAAAQRAVVADAGCAGFRFTLE